MNPTWLGHVAICNPIPPDVLYSSLKLGSTKKNKDAVHV